MKIVTAVYGDPAKQLPYLGALLDSLATCEPVIQVLVVSGFSDLINEILSRTYTQVGVYSLPPTLCTSLRSLASTREQRVALKTRTWELGLGEMHDGDDVLCLDSDTLILQPFVGALLNTPMARVSFTMRQDYKWPLNTGVVLFEGVSERTRSFMRRWVETCETSLSLPPPQRKTLVTRFGAVDQFAFVEELAKDAPGALRTLDAHVWNHDTCVNLDARVCIAHLKGCLPLLFDQRPWGAEHGDERTPETCRDLFRIWRLHYDHFLAVSGLEIRK